jgi:hypothetical protein
MIPINPLGTFFIFAKPLGDFFIFVKPLWSFFIFAKPFWSFFIFAKPLLTFFYFCKTPLELFFIFVKPFGPFLFLQKKNKTPFETKIKFITFLYGNTTHQIGSAVQRPDAVYGPTRRVYEHGLAADGQGPRTARRRTALFENGQKG